MCITSIYRNTPRGHFGSRGLCETKPCGTKARVTARRRCDGCVFSAASVLDSVILTFWEKKKSILVKKKKNVSNENPQADNVICVWRQNLSLSLPGAIQLVFPSPSYPGLQAHVYDPTVLVQVAVFTRQLWIPLEHSSTSAGHSYGLLNVLRETIWIII